MLRSANAFHSEHLWSPAPYPNYDMDFCLLCKCMCAWPSTGWEYALNASWEKQEVTEFTLLGIQSINALYFYTN